MDAEFGTIYGRVGRPSVPSERLLKALLLQTLFSIRSERLLVESLDYNLLYRWFVGLRIDDGVWDHSTFGQNRVRLFNEGFRFQHAFSNGLLVRSVCLLPSLHGCCTSRGNWRQYKPERSFRASVVPVSAMLSVPSSSRNGQGGLS